jgi:hypothetical protein
VSSGLTPLPNQPSLGISNLEGAMDDDKDDKNFVEKTIEAVKEIAHVASEAAKHAMEPEPIKRGDEVVVVPMVSDGMMGESMMPPFVVIRHKKKAPKTTATKAAKKTAKKTAKKSAKKNAAKKWKSPVKAAKKTTGKKAVKKKKKSRR